MEFSISIPADEDGFVLFKCPLCNEYFKITPDDYYDDNVLEIYCPSCGLISDNYLTEDVIELAEAKVKNYMDELLFTEMKKNERNFSKGPITFNAGNKSKPEYEKQISSSVDDLIITNFPVAIEMQRLANYFEQADVIAHSVELDMMNLNKKDLKKLLLEFNNISSRLMRVNYQDYSDVLKKFLNFLEEQSVIYNFIIDCGSPSYSIKDEIQKVTQSWKEIFDLGSNEKEEVANIYHILKYCIDEKIDIPTQIALMYSSSSKFQDSTDEFNKRVVYVLIRHIGKYLEKIGVDMGMDEDIKYTITVHNGQVNLAANNATINASQNNGVDMSTLLKLIDDVKQTITKDFTLQEKEEIEESLDAIRNELSQSSPKKGYIKTALRGLQSFTVKSVEFATAIASVSSFVMKIIGM